MTEMKVMYISTVRGRTERNTDKNTVYWGRAVRRTERGDKESFGKLLEDLPDTDPDGNEIVDGGTVEIYEVFDFDTGDFITLLRVPYQKPDQVPRAFKE
jgi:hypothetical protein